MARLKAVPHPGTELTTPEANSPAAKTYYFSLILSMQNLIPKAIETIGILEANRSI